MLKYTDYDVVFQEIPDEVTLAVNIAGCLRTAWYSGCAELPPHFPAGTLDYVKLGPYVAALGGLRSPTTNQRLYRLESDGSRTDLTGRFTRR